MPAKRTTDTRECPYCKEEVKAEAVLCKHCGSRLTPEKPSHGGTCPYCKESINPEATKCKHCKSILNGDQRSNCGCEPPAGFDPALLRGQTHAARGAEQGPEASDGIAFDPRPLQAVPFRLGGVGGFGSGLFGCWVQRVCRWRCVEAGTWRLCRYSCQDEILCGWYDP
jgi:Double zinc ribbon